MRLQDLHIVRLQIRVNGIVGILQIGQLARARGTHFAAGCRLTLGDPVITKRAFVGDVLRWMEVAATIRAGLDAVTATETIVLIDQHDPVGCVKRGAHWTDLCARGIRAVIAELRDKEIPSPCRVARGKTVHPAERRVDLRTFNVPVGDVVALDPGAKVALWHIVFCGARFYAATATDAFGTIQQHSPPVLGHAVVGRGFRITRQDKVPCDRGGRNEEQNFAA